MAAIASGNTSGPRTSRADGDIDRQASLYYPLEAPVCTARVRQMLCREP
jgi:hypothetical protein